MELSKNKIIFDDIILTPIGWLHLSADEEAITRIQHCQDQPQVEIKNHDLIELAKTQLHEYFSGKRMEFDLPIKFTGTDFQQKVWRALCQIPYGSHISYKKLAEMIGRDAGSARAVGGANNKNPIMLVVPCHRVCGQDGALVGFAAGLDVKEWLLTWERTQMSNPLRGGWMGEVEGGISTITG
jgi:methylated-DNA-[protein]-cysteine S-methyltransferase